MKQILIFIFTLAFAFDVNAQTEQRQTSPDSIVKYQLESIGVKDQTLRMVLPEVEKKFGRKTRETQYFWSLIHRQDSINEKEVINIIDNHGWLGISRVGEPANQALWLVIQHAPLKLQEKYLPYLKESVEKGESPGWHSAFLEDRILMRQGKKQIYGTQSITDPVSGRTDIYPIQDVENVNARREKIGLLPIKVQTTETDSITDIEGNVYHAVVIGKYKWMAENLKTATYNNGTAIPNITGDSAWVRSTGGAYCWYNNDKSKAGIYGALYNWYAVNTGMLCPGGWRVPSDEEWKSLEGFADSRYKAGDPVWDSPGHRGQDAGRRLKADTGWRSGGNGTDNVGFSALPGGERLRDSHLAGSNGFWWTNTADDTSYSWYRGMIYGMDEVSRDRHPKTIGFSVRCIRDN
jgi:uncharacterized protein (TIGR02145 family)